MIRNKNPEKCTRFTEYRKNERITDFIKFMTNFETIMQEALFNQ